MKLKKSIIGRWLFNNLSVVVIILFIAEIAFIVSAQNCYYSSAKQYMISKVNAVAGMLSRYSDDTSINFSVEARNMVENFSDKDKIELMAINSKGRIVLHLRVFHRSRNRKCPITMKLWKNLRKQQRFLTGTSWGNPKTAKRLWR